MNKVLIILAVAIIAAAGVTIALLPSDEAEEPLPETGDALGLVYGNADGNFVIDDMDKRIMEAIIADEKSLDDFPLADMNCDGTVDQKDLDMLQDYFDKKPMKLNVVEQNGSIVKVQYPIEKLVFLSGSALAPLVNVFDVYDRLTAVAYSGFDTVRDAPIMKLLEEKKIVELDPWGSAADNDLISKTDTQVMITEAHRMYDLDSDKNIPVLNDFGIDVLRLECKDPQKHMGSMAIMGILFDQTDRSIDYQQFNEKVLKEIRDKEGDKFGTQTMMAFAGHGWAAGKSSYSTMFDAAGGKNLVTDDKSYKPYHEGDQWIYEDQYKAEVYLLSGSTSYGGEGFTDMDIAKYDTYKNTYTWKNGGVYMFDLVSPTVVRVAYFAEALYPDLVGDGFGDRVHQEFVDRYFDESTDYKIPEDRFFMKIN